MQFNSHFNVKITNYTLLKLTVLHKIFPSITEIVYQLSLTLQVITGSSQIQWTHTEENAFD